MRAPYNDYLLNEYQKAIDSLQENRVFIETNSPEELHVYYKFLALSYSKVENFEFAVKEIKNSIALKPFYELPDL